MRLLKNIIKDDSKDFRRKANNLFQHAVFQVDKETAKFRENILSEVAMAFCHVDKLSYIETKQILKWRSLDGRLRHLADNFADRICSIWTLHRGNFDLLGRTFCAFIGRKATPPWKKVTLDLASPLKSNKNQDPREGYIHAYLQGMVDQTLSQIRQASLNEESFGQMMTRVKSALKTPNKILKQREDADDDGGVFQRNSDKDEAPYQSTYFDDNIDVNTGAFTPADYDRFIVDLQQSNQWSYRSVGKDRLEGKENDYLRKLEQVLLYDASSQLHDGLLQIGSEEMGIEDFAWAASGPNVCEECGIRDGLTTSEIADQVKDEYGEDPPPLHPNCNCQLIPQIKTDWAKSEVEAGGLQWDQETGGVYNVDQNEKDAGWSDMSFDQYLERIGV